MLLPRLCGAVRQQLMPVHSTVVATSALLQKQVFSTEADASPKLEESMDFPGGKVPFTKKVLARVLLGLQKCSS